MTEPTVKITQTPAFEIDVTMANGDQYKFTYFATDQNTAIADATKDFQDIVTALQALVVPTPPAA